MSTRLHLPAALFVFLVESLVCAGVGSLIPPASQIKTDRPRLLVRPRQTPLAISLTRLRSLPRDAETKQILEQLGREENAAAQAMVWLVTQDPAAADRAVKRMRAYRFPGHGKVDTFHIFGNLSELGLAYDWLYDFPGLTKEVQAEIRANAIPLAEEGLGVADDHMFHNYIWMSAGGVALWALATVGEDAASDRIFERIRTRFNEGLFPAWKYLDGLPSEPMGYWSLYVFAPGLWTILAAQSAFESDLVGEICNRQGHWLERNFENLIHSVLPDMRFIPWGDLQSGPNGGVTHEIAGIIDAATWALTSSHGAELSSWLAEKRGLARFYGETAMFYLLYTRNARFDQPVWPSPSFLAGGKHSGHFIARSGWGEGDTVVAFTCTDHFGDHHHYDQGSFIIYRRGLLAVDPPVYRTVRGPQQKTEHHSTLLVDGKPQRPVRGQWFKTVEEFERNLEGGRKLETGDIVFHDNGGSYERPAWSAVAGEFVQAYDCPELASCVRQLLFVRPSTVVVVDRLRATAGKAVPRVDWLLQVPAEPKRDGSSVVATNGKSWIRCVAATPVGAEPASAPTPVNTHAVTYSYPGGAERMLLVHVLEVGDGTSPGSPHRAVVKDAAAEAVSVELEGQTFTIEPLTVTAAPRS